ncbi:MAG: carbohydrate-binding family 9-like protein [Bacteroidota bacterium]
MHLIRSGSIGLFVLLLCLPAVAQDRDAHSLIVPHVEDFELTGDGKNPVWEDVEWTDLRQNNNFEESRGLESKFKVAYSDHGIYVLFENTDRILNATIEGDFKRIWREDVVEVFFWPDEDVRSYFEYELSPLNYELVLLLLEDGGSWIPFGYHGSKRATRHLTSVTGGEKVSEGSITGWMAEFFIPYELMGNLLDEPPLSGDEWRANFYRIDYDDGQTHFTWKPVDRGFHELDNYGTIRFE